MVKSLAKAYIVREIQPVVRDDLISKFEAFWEEATAAAVEVHIIKTLQQAIKNCRLDFALVLSKYLELDFIHGVKDSAKLAQMAGENESENVCNISF